MRVFPSSFLFLLGQTTATSWQNFEFNALEEILEDQLIADENIKVLDFPRLGDHGRVPAAVNIANSSYATTVTADSWCGVGKKFPRLCGSDGACFQCSSDLPGHDISEVLFPSRKFWASAIQNTQAKAQASVTVNLQADYQLSGLYLQLGPGITPKKLTIELEESSGDVKRLARVNFDGECDATQLQISDVQEICQNEPARANGEVYVNFLSRRPSQFSLATSDKLSAFIKGRKLRLVFQELLKDDYTTVNNAFYSLRRLALFGRCDCHGFSNSCMMESGEKLKCEKCNGGRYGAECQFCEGFLNEIDKGDCPKCQCSGFSNQCVYNDEEDKVSCVRCTGNREGDKCDVCKSGFYFANGNTLNECIPCQCDEKGTAECDTMGHCICKNGYSGEECDSRPEAFVEQEDKKPDNVFVQEVCQDYSYDCPAGLILSDSCGIVSIQPNFVRKLQKCSFILDNTSTSSRQSSIRLNVKNLKTLEDLGGFATFTNLETGDHIHRRFISDSSLATCSRRVRVQLTIPSETSGLLLDFAWANSRHTDEGRCSELTPEEILKNQISDSKSALQDFLTRSTRMEEPDQQQVLAKITKNFVDKFEAIKEKYNVKLQPVKTVLTLVASMSSASRSQFIRSRQINDQMQAQIDSTLAKLEVQFQSVQDVLQELEDEMDTVKSSLHEEVHPSQIQRLETTVAKLFEKENDFKDLWSTILEDSKIEAEHTSDLLKVVLDRFGRASEEGTCWFSDGTGVKTIDRYSESDFEFLPVEFRGSAGFSKGPFADRDFFPEVDWLEESDFNIEFDNLESRKSSNTKDQFFIEFENGNTVTGDLSRTVDGFKEASAHCSKDGKILAVIKNTANLNALVEKISDKEVDGPVFLGLKFGIYPVPWTWEARNVISPWKDGWANDQPAANPDKRCVAATATGWITQNCDSKLSHYVCLGKTGEGKHRYYIQSIVGGGATYAQAVKGCREKRRVLAVVATEKQDEALLDVFKQNSKIASAWIGLKSKGGDTEEKWQWVDGTIAHDIKLSEDRAATNGCLAVKKVDGKMQIGLVSCDVEGSFLCTELSHHRERRHIVHRPDRDPASIIHPASTYREFFEGVSDEDFTDVIQYDWQWPRYGWLADQARCVDVIMETYLNLTDFIGSIDLSVNEASFKSEIAMEGLEHVLGAIENDEHISKASEQWAEISANMDDAEAALEALRKYVKELDEAEILLKDITLESFKALQNDYLQKLEELERQWMCENIDFGELQIPNSGDENLYEPLCIKFTWAMEEVRAKLAKLDEQFQQFLQSDCWADVNDVYCEDVTPVSLGSGIRNYESCDGVLVDLLGEDQEQQFHCFIGGADFHIRSGAEDIVETERTLEDLRYDLNDPRFTGPEWTEATRQANKIGEDICSGKVEFSIDRELEDFERTFSDLMPGSSHLPKQLSPQKAEADILEGVLEPAKEIRAARDNMEDAIDFANRFDLDTEPDNIIDYMNEIIKIAEDEQLPGLKFNDLPLTENLVNENEEDNIVPDFEKYLKAKDDFEEELKYLEHLVDSSRGLLSRFDDNMNSMKFSGKQSVEINDPPPFDGHHQFELEFNLKLDSLSNNILTLKDGDGSQLIVETRRGELFAKLVEFDEAIVLSTGNPLIRNIWTRVKISSSGSAMFLQFYVLNCDDLGNNLDLEREDGGAANPCDPKANVAYKQLNASSRHWHIDSDHNDYEMTFGGGYSGRDNLFAVSNPMVNGLAVGLYDSTILDVDTNHELVVDEPIIHTATCYNIFSNSVEEVDGFGKSQHHAIDTCVCLDGDESYFQIDASNLQMIYNQRLQVQVDFIQNAPTQTALVTLIYNEDLGSYLALEKFGNLFRFSFRPNWDEDTVVVEDIAGPQTDDSYLRLYFGIYRKGKEKFYAVVYAKADEDGKTNSDIVTQEISQVTWKILSDSLGESPLIFGGHHLRIPSWIESELDSFSAPERSLAACLRLININDDSLNAEVYNTIDGVGIHRHRDTADRYNFHLEAEDIMHFEIERFNKEDQLTFSFHSENSVGSVARFGPVQLSINSDFAEVSGCSSREVSSFSINDDIEHVVLIRRTSRSHTVVEISRSDGSNSQFEIDCEGNEVYHSLVFGGDGFRGIIARPLVFNEQGITTDILNELRCREPDECAHIEFNKNASNF